jgi:hypothetical protein
MDQPDFRALTHELNALLVYLVSTHPNLHETVIRAYLYCSDRATTALATPPPEPPTDESLYELWEQEGFEGDFQDCCRFYRAVLERWGK